ncbi:MAG: HEAT repeat domain-containing protein [Planctomycetota bacterium]|nr:HEAT repeat domain-containing protein [Planctomycetota bacterium]
MDELNPTPAEPADLARSLADARPETAKPARAIFAKWTAERAVQVLHALWNEQTAAACWAAVEALPAHPASASHEPLRAFWRKLAEHEDARLRDAALEAAGRLDASAAAHLLGYWLGDPDAGLRRRALTRLLVLNVPAPECARRGLEDPDASVRAQALRLAARFPHPCCVAGLTKILKENEARRQAEALKALASFHNLLGLCGAAWLLEHGAGEARAEAQRMLPTYRAAELGRILLEELPNYPADGPAPDHDSLALLLTQSAARDRDRMLRQPAPAWLRRALIETEARMPAGHAGAVRRLRRLAQDEDPALRAAAVAALERHDEPEPGAVLGTLLTQPWSDVRRMAIEGLGRAGPAALRLLHGFLSDPDPELRRATLEALSELLPEDAPRLWTRALKDADGAIRLLAFRRLAGLPDEDEPRRGLAAASRHADVEIRRLGLRELLSRDVVLPSLAKGYLRTLDEVLAADAARGPHEPAPTPGLDWTAANLVALVDALAATTPYGFTERLVAAARHRSAVVRRAAAECLLRGQKRRQAREALAMLADTEDPDVLRRVATALAEVRDARGLTPLIRALDECPGQREKLEPYLARYPKRRELRFLLRSLKQPFASMKRYALRELKELDSPEMIEPLLQASQDPDPEIQQGALRALAKFAKHPAVYERLIQIRDAGDDGKVKQEALAALLDLDSPGIVEPLLEATRDEDYEVQIGAVVALGKLAARPEVLARLLEMLDYGDVGVRETVVRTLGEHKVREAVPALVRLVGNPFLSFRVQEALTEIGDRSGLLALKRHKIRQRLYGKKKEKGPIKSMTRTKR